MKTKTKILSLAFALVLVLAFTACGAKDAPMESASDTAASSESEPQATLNPELPGEGITNNSKAFATAGGGESKPEEAPQNPSDKVIYSGTAEIETLEFDKTLEDLSKLIADCGGFVQSSNITGNDFNTSYYGGKSYRSAEYSIRIPADKFKSVTESLSTLGNVPYSSTNAENITMQYRDSEARLVARQAEEKRLIELLSNAKTVEEILQIESRLSDVRYNIESLTSQIENWDNLVSYSTLQLNIREVTLYTDNAPATLSYGEQLKDGFLRSLQALGRFFKGFFRYFVAALPVLFILAIVAVVVVVIVKATKKKHTPKNNDKKDE